MTTLTHVYTVTSPEPVRLGSPVSHLVSLGRFSVHFAGDASALWMMPVEVPQRVEVTRLAGERPLILEKCSAQLITAGRRTAQLLLRHESDADPEKLTQYLKVMCHERQDIQLNGLSLVNWLRASQPAFLTADLAKDVLQFVEVDSVLSQQLRTTDGSLSATSLGLVYRERRLGEVGAGNSVRQPVELNDAGSHFAAHGRGVMVVAGHDGTPVAALMYVISELLFAAGDLRGMRGDLSKTLRGLQGSPVALSGHTTDVAFIEALTIKLRHYRLVAALDIAPALNGLETPDLVLDNLRQSFAAALQLPEQLDSANTMLQTLSDVAETALTEAQLASSSRAEERQQRWQFLVGVASGLVVPIALLISFFGIGTHLDIVPNSSLFDVRRYWQPWSVTVVAVLGLTGISAWQYRRSYMTTAKAR